MAAKLAPPVAVTGLTLGGIQLQDWVLIATLVYTLLAICERLFRWVVDWRGRRGDCDDAQ